MMDHPGHDGAPEHCPIVPLVLSGGTGTRLWPLSRESFPKQFWPLVTGASLMQDALARASGDGFAPPLIVCNEAHRFLVAEQVREAAIVSARILLEPEGRNSAPAVAAACLLVAETTPDAVLWMMPADAAIRDSAALGAALAVAARAARAGHLVTFGITPDSPETGYGYLQTGPALGGIEGAYAVARFIEKPDPEIASRLIADGRHLWNSGMFVFTAATMLAELAAHAPDLLAAVRPAVAARREDLDFLRLGAEFASSPSISLDYAVAERSDRVAVVPATLGWSDVGSWSALWSLADKDAAGNAVSGEVVLEDTSGCYIRGEGVLTAAIGLRDVVLVATRDAVLAVHRDQAQSVKPLVERLRREGRAEAQTHARHHRPWGFYEQLIEGERFQVKRIVVAPGRRLSLQKHFHRAEHWVVVRGTALVHRDGQQTMLRENESIYLPLGSVHRLENPGRIPLTLIEVQSGAYLGEDDIIRFEDTYGRS